MGKPAVKRLPYNAERVKKVGDEGLRRRQPSFRASMSDSTILFQTLWSATLRSEQIIVDASKKAPEKFRPYIEQAAPVLAALGEVVTKVEPIIEQVGVAMTAERPCHPCLLLADC